MASKFTDFNPVDYSVQEILQEKVYKTYITDLHLLTTALTNGYRSDDMIQLGPLTFQSLFYFVQISGANMRCITFLQ